MSKARIAIIGIGNTILQDEGLGMFMTQLMEKKYQFNPSIDFHYIGTGGLALADILSPYDFVLILDTIIAEEQAGSILTLHRHHLLPGKGQFSKAGHAIGLQSALEFAQKADTLPPHFSLVGMVPDQIGFGKKLSKKVQQAIPRYEEEILRLLHSRSIATTLQSPATNHFHYSERHEFTYFQNTSNHFRALPPEQQE